MTDDADGAGGLLERVREKLVRSKQRWAREGRLLTGRGGRDRLPPGQRLVDNWPVLDLGIQPHVPLELWKLTVDGAVEAPTTWDWDGFLALPQVVRTSDIHCVTAWSRYDNRWRGVAAGALLAQVRPTPEARYVLFHSHDGYTTNLALAEFDRPEVLLAHEWQGAPISKEHGAPVRVVVPHRYFWKSAKWLRRIELSVADRSGFWEERGYHNEGDPWKEERYD